MDNLTLTRWFIGPKFHSFSHSPKEQYETLFLKCAAVEAGLYCSFTIQGNYITRSVLPSTMTDEANFSEILWFSNSNILHGWAEYRFKNHNLLHPAVLLLHISSMHRPGARAYIFSSISSSILAQGLGLLALPQLMKFLKLLHHLIL